jgi:hypothetical protein
MNTKVTPIVTCLIHSELLEKREVTDVSSTPGRRIDPQSAVMRGGRKQTCKKT